jgi:hypothetical protein
LFPQGNSSTCQHQDAPKIFVLLQESTLTLNAPEEVSRSLVLQSPSVAVGSTKAPVADVAGGLSHLSAGNDADDEASLTGCTESVRAPFSAGMHLKCALQM